jgi:predicted nucleic acid-binding protein
MTGKYFIDSNIWLYLLLADDKEKYNIVKEFIDVRISNKEIIISWQVLNEVCTNLKKQNFAEKEIEDIIEWICDIAIVQDFTKELLLEASALRQKMAISFWDSLIVSAAQKADCKYLISEDMQNNQKIKGLTIKNIFKF